MNRYLKTSKDEIGRSPQELIFRGNRKIDEVLLRSISFNDSEVEENLIQSAKDLLASSKNNAVTWINVDGLHDLEVIQEIGTTLDMDPLILADVLETNARPKIHDYENWIFLSLKMVQYDEKDKHFSVENLSVIFNDSILITFQEKKGTIFEPVRERIRNHKRTLRNSKTDYLVFALLDTVIDHYLYVLSFFGEKIESFEDVLLEKPDKNVIEQINLFKKELNYIRKGINLPEK